MSRRCHCSLLLLLVVVACAPPPAVRREWKLEDGFATFLNLSSQELAMLENMTAEASIELRQGAVRESGTALIQMKGTDLFRVDVRGPFYSHVFTALLEGDSLTVYGPAVDGAWKGGAQGPLLMHLTGVDLGLYTLPYALLGLVEPGALATDIDIEYPRADRAIIPFYGQGTLRRLWVDLHSGLVAREHLETLAGQLLVERRLAKDRRVANLLLPQRVEITQGDVAISLDYRNYDIDKELSVDIFSKGVPRQQLRRIP
jgi:outer membrane lipoprotein-sorting protein